jgi:hypothetical protein
MLWNTEQSVLALITYHQLVRSGEHIDRYVRQRFEETLKTDPLKDFDETSLEDRIAIAFRTLI